MTVLRDIRSKNPSRALDEVVLRAVGLFFEFVRRKRLTLCRHSGFARMINNPNPFTEVIASEPEHFLGIVPYLAWGSPELIFPLGFDQIRIGSYPLVDNTVSNDLDGVVAEMAQNANGIDDKLCPQCASAFRSFYSDGPQFRSLNGVWHTQDYLWDLLTRASNEPRDFAAWLDVLFDNWQSALDRAPQQAQAQLVSMPELWIPGQPFRNTLVHRATQSILDAIAAGHSSLQDISWRDLEDLVAALLENMGLSISVTPRSGDGGRDVIARGELLPGEPVVFAVEVKHKPVVGIEDLRAALWANRHFPALLFATSGRFSAGVMKEKRGAENSLRLYLKDGLALTQWIHAYALESITRPPVSG
jgi:hypothetical protein